VYLTFLNATQTGEANGLFCPVLIEWNFGDQLPDLVEIYNGDTLIKRLDVKSPTETSSATVFLPAGTVVNVRVCPRLVENKNLQDQMPNIRGVDEYWESFCQARSITTKAKPGTGEVPKKTPKPAPIIDSLVIIPASVLFLSPLITPIPSIIKQRNRIRVSWTCSNEFSSFLVGWTSNYDRWGDGSPERKWDSEKYAPVGGQINTEEGGRSGSFILEGIMPGLEYEFSVKGRDSGFLGLDPTYSNWSSPAKIVGQRNLSSLRKYLQNSNLDESNGIKQYLFTDAGSLRSFMQLL